MIKIKMTLGRLVFLLPLVWLHIVSGLSKSPPSARNITSPLQRLPGSYIGRDFPCPVDSAIYPCLCVIGSDDALHLDCSDVSSEDQLAGVFQEDFPVKNFREFYMSGNSVVLMLKRMFNGVTFEYFNVASTNLEVISVYALEDSENTLGEIDITLSYLDADTFPLHLLNQFSQLELLTLSYQRFTWIPPIISQSLRYLSFYGNQITGIEPGSLSNIPNVYFIDFSSNLLTTLEPHTFILPNAAITINLYYNSIMDIQPGAFQMPLNSGALSIYLDLQGNDLTTLDEDALGEIFPHIAYVDFSSNPLDCGCDVAWLVLSDSYRNKISSNTQCADSRLFSELDPNYYLNFC